MSSRSLTVIPAPSGTPLPPSTPPLTQMRPRSPPNVGPRTDCHRFLRADQKGPEGLGLRIPLCAGVWNSNQLFIGYDAEVFVVNGGPRQVDGYTWYSLVAPYDATRTGWAASDFFTIIPPAAELMRECARTFVGAWHIVTGSLYFTSNTQIDLRAQ